MMSMLPRQTLEFTAHVPDNDPRLSFGTAVIGRHSRIRFGVQVISDSKTTELHNQTVDAPGAWHDASYDLRHWAGRDAELLAAGCLDRRLDTLQPGLIAILSRGDAMARFDAESRSRIEAYCAQIPQLIAALRECGLPETLVHGDFHAGNVAVDGDRTIIFDWTDACLSHPLFDLATFLPDDPVERAELLHAYFSAWVPEISEEQMDRAWEIAEPLAGVHHAVSYTRILEAVDSRDHWEFDSDVSLYNKWQTLMIEAEATGRIPDVLAEKQREVERAQQTEAEQEALAVLKDLPIDPERLNVNGGAIALGHPIGCTGTRILVTLLYEMRRRGARRGLGTLCVSGGLGMAMALELLS